MQKIAEIRPIAGGGAGAGGRSSEPTVLLTQRAALPNHLADFVSRRQDGKVRRPSARRRCAKPEEIGLDRALVEPLGYLDLYMTTQGFRIVPLIARVKPGFALTLNTGEVDATFEVPLAFLMDQANVQRHSRDWQGMTRHYYAITFGEHYIWGVTAGILRNLHERIYT